MEIMDCIANYASTIRCARTFSLRHMGSASITTISLTIILLQLKKSLFHFVNLYLAYYWRFIELLRFVVLLRPRRFEAFAVHDTANCKHNMNNV